MTPELKKLLENFNLDNYAYLENLTPSEWHIEITLRAVLLNEANSGNFMSKSGIENLLENPIQSKQDENLKPVDYVSDIDKFLFAHKYGLFSDGSITDLSPKSVWAFNEQVAKYLKLNHPEKFNTLTHLTNEGITHDALGDLIFLIKIHKERGESKIQYQNGEQISVDSAKKMASMAKAQLEQVFEELGNSYHLLVGKEANIYDTRPPILVDLTASDADLKKSFDKWLQEKRKLLAKNKKVKQGKANPRLKPISIKRGFTENDIQDWIKHETIPYLDIVLIAKCVSSDISLAEIADRLYLREKAQGIKRDWVSKVRQVTRPKAEQMIDVNNLKMFSHYQ